MRRFLTFVVEETLAGNAEAIKEYVIGVRVFDKPETYDPQGDSTVRSEAVKLRAKLDRYYELTAERESLVISIPKESYVPVFAVRKDGPHHPSAELSEAPAFDVQTAYHNALDLDQSEAHTSRLTPQKFRSNVHEI